MMPSFTLVRCWLALLLVCASPLALANAYDAKLPEELHSSPKLCDYAPCAEVFPGATSFSERKGNPPYVEAHGEQDGKPALLGYVVLSTDVTDTPAYSGKPVVTLIGLDTGGRFVGTKVLKHSEPILLLGIPEDALTKFLDQYLCKHVGDDIQVGGVIDDDGHVGLDAISSATTTVRADA